MNADLHLEESLALMGNVPKDQCSRLQCVRDKMEEGRNEFTVTNLTHSLGLMNNLFYGQVNNHIVPYIRYRRENIVIDR